MALKWWVRVTRLPGSGLIIAVEMDVDYLMLESGGVLSCRRCCWNDALDGSETSEKCYPDTVQERRWRERFDQPARIIVSLVNMSLRDD
ncbi:hypothetical protein MUK42_35147 [Musa troglodytarum]|uniref:Uncharacterized protein n=1 Tax=Musa troglodytarum TaxID=320322 RepID=A0A9E7HBY7_9LILI|nr:hypothetical protein MUK42_35147 [Musa troglodytarum]